MIIRIYWGRIYPGSWASIEDKYRELNAIETPGLLARFVAQDVNDEESMYTLTYWQDLASVETWEASDDYKNVFLAAIKPFTVGAKSVSLCAVRVSSGLTIEATKSAIAPR